LSLRPRKKLDVNRGNGKAGKRRETRVGAAMEEVEPVKAPYAGNLRETRDRIASLLLLLLLMQRGWSGFVSKKGKKGVRGKEGNWIILSWTRGLKRHRKRRRGDYREHGISRVIPRGPFSIVMRTKERAKRRADD